MLSCNCATIDLYHTCPHFTFIQPVLVPTGGAFEVWTSMIQVGIGCVQNDIMYLRYGSSSNINTAVGC